MKNCHSGLGGFNKGASKNQKFPDIFSYIPCNAHGKMPIDAARLPILTGWWEGVIGGLGLIRVTSALNKPNIRNRTFLQDAWRGVIP